MIIITISFIFENVFTLKGRDTSSLFEYIFYILMFCLEYLKVTEASGHLMKDTFLQMFVTSFHLNNYERQNEKSTVSRFLINCLPLSIFFIPFIGYSYCSITHICCLSIQSKQLNTIGINFFQQAEEKDKELLNFTQNIKYLKEASQ